MASAFCGRARRAGCAVVGWFLLAAPCSAGRAGVTLSPLSSDRKVLEKLFTDGGPEVRFVFSPRFPDRPRAPDPPPVLPSAPELLFNGMPLPAYRFGSGADALLAGVIDRSRYSIQLSLPAFAFPRCAEALVRARRRRVTVRLLTEYGQVNPGRGAYRSDELRALIWSGVEVRTLPGDGPSGALRGSFGIFDERLLETGSLSWSGSVPARDALIFRDEPALADGFGAYWSWMWAQAKPVSGLAVYPPAQTPPAEPAGSLRFQGEAWPVWTAPAKSATEARLIAAVRACRVSVDMVLPGLSRGLAQAAAYARSRGATVRVAAGPWADPALSDFLTAAGVLVFYPQSEGVLREQFAVLDGALAQIGSFDPATQGFGPAVFSTTDTDLRGFAAEFAELARRGK